jgi:hypothetical protein
VEQEAIIVAFRKHTLLPLDDCLYALQAHGPPTDPLLFTSLSFALWHQQATRGRRRKSPAGRSFDSYLIGFFHIDLAEVRTAEGKHTSLWPSTAPPSSPSSNSRKKPPRG